MRFSDLAAVRDQDALFGPVASDSTAFRLIDATTPPSDRRPRINVGAPDDTGHYSDDGGNVLNALNRNALWAPVAR